MEKHTSQARQKNSRLLKSMTNAAYKLSLFVVISIMLLLTVRYITAPQIAHEEQEAMMLTFSQVLPFELYDNNPLNDTITLTDPNHLSLLGTKEPVTIYRARKDNQPAGLIFTAVAPNGYSGNITLLIGVLPDGSISGLRVLKHRETPGLGDKIDIKKDDWILSFNGKKVDFSQDSDLDDDHRWAVKKDGGEFDQFTGATITPRAVIGAAKKALIFVNHYGESLYE